MWQPIETAPNDDTQIIACFMNDGAPEIRVIPSWSVHTNVSSREAARMYRVDGSWPQPKRFYFSHWMPLPDLPKG